MICGICNEKEGEALTFHLVKLDGTTAECLCHVCQPHRCKDCQEVWGKKANVDGVDRPMHEKPRRREAVLATRENLR